MPGLTNRQRLFVDCYFQCNLNATKAAIAAGYSKKTAYSIGSENLKKPQVLAEIERRMNKYTMSANEVLYHLSAIGRGDMDDLLDAQGNPSLETARANNKTSLIKKLHTKAIPVGEGENARVKTVVTKVELYDRLRALELLAKHHDLINRVKIDDWRTQAIEDIRAKIITFDALAGAFDLDLATELFKAAGVPIQATEGEA